MQRRIQYFEKLEIMLPGRRGRHHPFAEIAKRCLDNRPAERPEAIELLHILKSSTLVEPEGQYEGLNKIEILAIQKQQVALYKRITVTVLSDAVWCSLS